MRELSVLFAGETAIIETKWIIGVDEFTEAQYRDFSPFIREPIEAAGHRFTHVAAHEVPLSFPLTTEELDPFDVVIISDVGANSLQLHPATTQEFKTSGDRLGALVDFVERGGGLMMIGGWLTFQGIEAKARYAATPLQGVLPVELLPGADDRVEVPQGFRPRATEAGRTHPVLSGIPPELPTMLFYNRVRNKPDSEMLLRHEDDPILTVSTHGAGRTAAFAAEVAPHGATEEFTGWELYPRFWTQLVEWLGGADDE